MFRSSLVIMSLSLSLALPASADTVFGIYAGAATWQQQASGNVASGISQLDVEQDLGVEDEDNNVFYVAIEHPIPLLPNIRLQHTDITLSGDNLLSRDIEFNGSAFTVSEQVVTDLDLTQADAILYYEVLDNYLSLDLGLAARWVDGFVRVNSTLDGAEAEFTGVVPLLYAKARIDLPLSGWWVGAQAQGIAYDGDQLIDATAQIGWETVLGLGLELGYRTFSLELEEFDEVDTAEIDIDGVYFGLTYHF